MHRSHSLFLCAAAPLALLVLAAGAQAKEKKPKSPPKDPQDQIEVVGHIPLTGGPIRRFLATQHYSSFYLYGEHDAGKGVMLIDVTKAARPKVVSDIAYPAGAGAGSLLTVAGTAALVTEDPGPQATPPAQTLRIMDFSDPQHPKVAREFTGVTATTRDEKRGLIFLANSEGIWILHQNFAIDPEVEKAYSKQVLYDH